LFLRRLSRRRGRIAAGFLHDDPKNTLLTKPFLEHFVRFVLIGAS